jgi:hypothetical protein
VEAKAKAEHSLGKETVDSDEIPHISLVAAAKRRPSILDADDGGEETVNLGRRRRRKRRRGRVMRRLRGQG